MPFVQARGVVVHYDLRGPRDAPVVMFGNSLGTDMHLWDAQLDALAGAWRVLRYDMRGHGLTEAGDPGAGIGALADDAAALLAVLGIARASYVGLSIGGMVGQRFAAAHPERLDALMLCATASRIGTAERWNARIAAVEAGGTPAVADAVVGGWFTSATHARRPELIRGFATMLGRTSTAGYIAGCRAVRDADLRAEGAAIAARTMVVSGAADPTATPAMGAELAAAIAGAEHAVVADAAHIVNAEQPGAFNDLLLRFLKG